VPAIYLLRTSPCASSVLPSIAAVALGRATLVVDGIHELAASSGNSTTITRRLVVSYTRLLTLASAPPSFHGGVQGRLFSSFLTSRHRLLLLSEVERPVLPGLSSRPLLQRDRRQTAAVLLRCKGTKKRAKSKRKSHFFLKQQTNNEK